MNMNPKTSKLTILAMMCAIAYVVMIVGRIPMVLFLKYDPKDVIVVIAGFIYGPLAALSISVIVSFVEMFTVSDTGFIGLVMNILSTCAFACIASYIYKKKHTIAGAVTGLTLGVLLMTAVMLLWNYLITPIYMGYPREAIVKLLLPAFLPFNLVKGGLNTALTLLLYKPLVTALRRSHLLPPSPSADSKNSARTFNTGLMLVALAVLATCILFTLVLQGVL